MPSESEKQHKYWTWVLHGKKDATDKEKAVAKEFLEADRASGKYQPRKPSNRNQ